MPKIHVELPEVGEIGIVGELLMKTSPNLVQIFILSFSNILSSFFFSFFFYSSNITYTISHHMSLRKGLMYTDRIQDQTRHCYELAKKFSIWVGYTRCCMKSSSSPSRSRQKKSNNTKTLHTLP